MRFKDDRMYQLLGTLKNERLRKIKERRIKEKQIMELKKNER